MSAASLCGYGKALQAARDLIYVEDQYLWSSEVAAPFAQALRERPGLRLVAVVPALPGPQRPPLPGPNAVGRERAVRSLRAAGGDRVAIYGLENVAGAAVYVHAKVCIIDDVWASVGSDNLNRRSWTHDSELTAAVWDEGTDGASPFAVALRRRLAAEHLELDGCGRAELDDPSAMVRAFADVRGAAAGVARRRSPRAASAGPAAAGGHAAPDAARPGLGRRPVRRGVRPRRQTAGRTRSANGGSCAARARPGARRGAALRREAGRTRVPARAPPAPSRAFRG